MKSLNKFCWKKLRPAFRDRSGINFTVCEEKSGSDLDDFSAGGIAPHTSKEKSSRGEPNFPSETVKIISERSLRPGKLSLALLLIIGGLQAQETTAEKVMKYNLSICSIFKNEAPFLKEWIEYYRLVGVDHFYLYNNGSTDRYLSVLRPYLKEGIVTLINWSDALDAKNENYDEMWALSTQLSAYENATQFRAVHETKWLVFLDINEFLISSEMNKLVDLLQKYEDYPGITLQTDFFDASNINKLPPRKLVVETVELTAPELNPPREVTKTIFKPNLCLGLFWPPCECRFQYNESAIAVRKNELRVNRYINRAYGHFHLGKRKEKLDVDNRLLSEEELTELLKQGYEIEDQDRPIYRYIKKLLRKLGYDAFD